MKDGYLFPFVVALAFLFVSASKGKIVHVFCGIAALALVLWFGIKPSIHHERRSDSIKQRP